MSNLLMRQALATDMETIYRMGFDVWAGGMSEDDYLLACRNSRKYQRGTWYLLTDGSKPVSSLILYRFQPGQAGIGSIATSPSYRNMGYASCLLRMILDQLQEEQIFLYADIAADFYTKFGFSTLPSELQLYPKTICMLRTQEDKQLPTKELVPSYF